MSQTEVVTVLKVETGNSENTIKSIKKEITDLKKALEGAEIGSEAFEKASKDLADAQQRLKSVMDSTKKTVSAAEGSYDALVATMAQLKKEWRSTADEAKRNEIGKQIDAINTELKELDATLGNHQRNVGNYKGDIIDAYREIQGEVKKTNTVLSASAKPIDKASEAAYDYGKAWSDVQKTTEQTRAKFESLQKLSSGVASGFAAVQGAAALLGSENENLQETFVKVQSAMAIAQGVGGLKDLIEGFSQAKTAFKGASMGLKAMTTESTAATAAMNGTTVATNTATVATNNFKRALIATGIGAIVVLLGTLIANWDKISKLWNNTSPQEKAAEAMRDINYEASKMANETAAKNIVRLKELQREYTDLGDCLDKKKKFVEEYSSELEAMNIIMNNVNDADDIFINRTDDYIEALKKRAKADALKEKASENYKKALDIISDAEKEYVEKAKNIVQPDGVIGKVKQIFGMFQIATGTFADDYAKDIAEARYLMEEQFNALWEQAEALEDEADTLMYGSEAERKKKEAERKAAAEAKRRAAEAKRRREQEASEAQRIAERAKQALIDTKEEELAELERIYNEELALLKKHNIATTNLTNEYLDKQTEILRETLKVEGNEQEQLTALENFYNERIRIYTEAGISTVELTAQFEAEKNSIIQSYEEQRKAALKQISDDGKTEKELEIQELTEEYDTYLELFKDHKEELLLVEQWYKDELAKIDEKYKEKKEEPDSGTTETHKQTMEEFIDSYGEMYKRIREGAGETAANVAISFTQALSSASQILSAIQAGIEEDTKEGFEKSKKYQIAQAGINMAQGILAAISSAMMIPPPMGTILGIINAGTVATVGGIQIANIKKRKFDGSGGDDVSSINGVGATPNVSMSDMLPINYTKNVLTDTETAEMNKGNRVYVVESDISKTQNEVAVKEANSSF